MTKEQIEKLNTFDRKIKYSVKELKAIARKANCDVIDIMFYLRYCK